VWTRVRQRDEIGSGPCTARHTRSAIQLNFETHSQLASREGSSRRGKMQRVSCGKGETEGRWTLQGMTRAPRLRSSEISSPTYDSSGSGNRFAR